MGYGFESISSLLVNRACLTHPNSPFSSPLILTEEDMMASTPNSPYTSKACFALLDKVCPDSPLPRECEQFQEVKVALQRKNSNKDSHAIAFQGMSPGEAAAAASARERGHLNNAQIQRRMTNSKKRTLW